MVPFMEQDINALLALPDLGLGTFAPLLATPAPGTGASLQATGPATPPSPLADPQGVLPLVDAAQSLWQAKLGLPAPMPIDVTVGHLSGGELAEARITAFDAQGRPSAGTIVVDANAAGLGWFIDPTPLSSNAFARALTPSAFQALPDSAAAGKYDLLTVLLHEMGHLAGFTSDFAGFASHLGTIEGSQIFVAPDSTAALISGGEHLDGRQYPNDLMDAELSPSIRRLPSPVDVQILSIARGTTPPPGGFSLDSWDSAISLISPSSQQPGWNGAGPGSVGGMTTPGSGGSQTVSPGLIQWVSSIPSGAVVGLPSQDDGAAQRLIVAPAPDDSGGFTPSSLRADRPSSTGVRTPINAMPQAPFALITGPLGLDSATSPPKSSSIGSPSGRSLRDPSAVGESLVPQAGGDRPALTRFTAEGSFLSTDETWGPDTLILWPDSSAPRVPAEPAPETNLVRAQKAAGDASRPERPPVPLRITRAPVVAPSTPPAAWATPLDAALRDATLVKTQEAEPETPRSSSPVITALALALAGEAAKGIVPDRGDASGCDSAPVDFGEPSSPRGRIHRLPVGWLRRLWSSIRKIPHQAVGDPQ